MHVAITLTVLGARMSIFFIIKVKISFKWSYIVVNGQINHKLSLRFLKNPGITKAQITQTLEL
jgi:hypothetical protein